MSTIDQAQYIPLGRKATLRRPSIRPTASSIPKARDAKQDRADAFPALLTASKAAFGDVKVIFFTTEEVANRPERYTSRLLVVIPDGPRHAFPWSNTSSNVFDAKTNAAVKAVRAGALKYLLQWLPPRTFQAEVAKPAPKKHTRLVFDSEKPTEALNAGLRLLDPQGSQSWVISQLEDGYAAVLTIGLPSGRLIYGSHETPAGCSVKHAKQTVFQKALEAGLLTLVLAELDRQTSICK